MQKTVVADVEDGTPSILGREMFEVRRFGEFKKPIVHLGPEPAYGASDDKSKPVASKNAQSVKGQDSALRMRGSTSHILSLGRYRDTPFAFPAQRASVQSWRGKQAWDSWR